jgi:hypothetical protein
MPRNPLRDDSQPFETLKGKKIINDRNETIVQFPDQNGNLRQYVTESVISEPDGQGGYINRTYKMPVYDRLGNPLPEDPNSVIFSHSRLPITSPDQLAHCASFLHPGSLSRNILVGQDGRRTFSGGICSRCDFWMRTIYFGLSLLGLGVVFGLFKAVGLFY